MGEDLSQERALQLLRSLLQGVELTERQLAKVMSYGSALPGPTQYVDKDRVAKRTGDSSVWGSRRLSSMVSPKWSQRSGR